LGGDCARARPATPALSKTHANDLEMGFKSKDTVTMDPFKQLIWVEEKAYLTELCMPQQRMQSFL
jgi:hypothetical protein